MTPTRRDFLLFAATISTFALVCLPLIYGFQDSYLQVLPNTARPAPLPLEEAAALAKVRLVQDSGPLVSSDGRRVFRISAGALVLAGEGEAESAISPPGVTVTSAAINDAGTRATFFAAQSTGRSYLYIWEEGFAAKKLIAQGFAGPWKIGMSANGRRVIIFPASAEGKFDGTAEIPAEDSAGGMVLEMHEQAQAPSAGEGSGRGLLYTTLVPFSKFAGIPPQDLNGDRATDILLFAPGEGAPFWRGVLLDGVDGPQPKTVSAPGQRITWRVGDGKGVPVPGDYDGDGTWDLATYTPGFYPGEAGTIGGNWDIYLSGLTVPGRMRFSPQRRLQLYWGFGAMKAVPADYDGDGASDPAVFDPQTATWHVLRSSGGFNLAKAGLGLPEAVLDMQWGLKGDLPLPGDYNGDGCSDFAVVREETVHQELHWLIRVAECGKHSENRVQDFVLGVYGDIALSGDFDGDGAYEAVVYNAKTSSWKIRSQDGKITELSWGVAGGEPFLGDFDGDYRADPAFFTKNGEFNLELMPSRGRDKMRDLFGSRGPAITRLKIGGNGAVPVEALLGTHQRNGSGS